MRLSKIQLDICAANGTDQQEHSEDHPQQKKKKYRYYKKTEHRQISRLEFQVPILREWEPYLKDPRACANFVGGWRSNFKAWCACVATTTWSNASDDSTPRVSTVTTSGLAAVVFTALEDASLGPADAAAVAPALLASQWLWRTPTTRAFKCTFAASAAKSLATWS